MATASFHFDDSLNVFLSPARRGRAFEVSIAGAVPVKHLIETLGVPHTEVERILVNDRAADFGAVLRADDRVEVQAGRGEDATPGLPLREWPREGFRFIADVHLGALAHRLRMAGFDTLFAQGYQDREIAALAAAEGRIVLTRDRDLLMHRAITHGCYIHALKPDLQFRELVARLKLGQGFRPFTRCLECNAPLQAVTKAEVRARLPPSVCATHECFTCCPRCGRVFWKGSHWRRMGALLESVSRGTDPAGMV